MNGPLFSANYNGLQAQVTRNAGTNASLGLVYTYSHAFNYADNGAGTGSSGPAFSYPGYYKMNRAQANQDQKHNLQIWGIYSPAFRLRPEVGQQHSLLSEIVGGWQITGQYSYFGGLPFSVTANSNTLNAPGSTLYAQLVAPYKLCAATTGPSAARSFRRQGVVQIRPRLPTRLSRRSAQQIPPSPRRFSPTPTATSSAGLARESSTRICLRASAYTVRANSRFGVEVFNLFNHPYLNLNNPGTTVPTTANVNAGNYGTFGIDHFLRSAVLPDAGGTFDAVQRKVQLLIC